MSVIKEFCQATIDMIEFLQQSEGDRDETISKVEELLDRREGLMTDIVPPYTPEEAEMGKQIIQLNATLDQLLKLKKIIIQQDIKDLKAKKESNTKYVNPYQSLSTDGMFYDKRK